MSTPINSAGPAMPFFKETDDSEGMTVRDYFAGQALAGMLMNYTTAKFGLAEISVANHAYKLADAMLAAREEVTK
jgi:hypothetical protein